MFRLSEEMARIDLGVATAFLAIALGIDPIIVGGTEEQRQRWLGRIADEGLIVAYGVTEPAAGSNIAALETVAEPVTTDDGAGYRLNGVKQFITNGGVAQIYTILARTPGGPSFFVIERDKPGLSAGPNEHKHGICASNTTQVILEDVVVPASQLLGLEEGKGLEQANKVFGYTRLMVAGLGIGAGEEALARAVAYSRDRRQFGRPLCQMQGFTHKLLVPHAVRLEAARAHCEEVAGRLDAGEHGLQVEGSVAKLFATEAGNQAADAALQALGGYGYMHEYEVEKIRRDVRITTIYEGTSEIQQSIIGTNRWRSVVRSKGAFYTDQAEALGELAVEGVGLEAAALAANALAQTVLICHAMRLPREQWVLFELARLMAEVETAIALARKAARTELGSPQAELIHPCSRLHASSAAREVVFTGLTLLESSGRFSASDIATFRREVRFDDMVATAGGGLEDMARVTEALLGR